MNAYENSVDAYEESFLTKTQLMLTKKVFLRNLIGGYQMKKALRIGMCLLIGIHVFPLTINAATSADTATAAALTTSQLTNPTELKAVADNNQVGLSWNAVTGAVSYNVKRSMVNGGPYETIASHIAATSYLDSTALNGVVYYYVVTAVTTTTESMISPQAKAAPYAPVVGVPAIPSDFAAAANDGSVYLTWSAVTGASSYTVRRSETSGGPYTTTVSSGLTILSYTDKTVVNGQQYYYVVTASNSSGESANTEELIVAPSQVIVVSQDGTGNFMTVQDAVNSIPVNNTARTVIYIREGEYREKVTVAAPFVSFVGSGRDKTKIVYDLSNAKMPNQAINAASVTITGNNFIAENLTFANDAPPSEGQALALAVNADQAVFENVKMVGYQDTLYAGITANSPRIGRQYYHNSVIQGRVDYIYGPASAAVFDHVDAISINTSDTGTGGYVTAAATKNTTDAGLVFINSRLLKNSSTTGLHYLGRPWQDFPSVRYINTWMDDHIHPAGWTTMQVDPYYYAEYNSSGPGASPSTRVMSTQMTAAEASDFTIPRIFDGWDPSKKVILPMAFPQVTPSVAPALPDGQNGSYTKPVIVYMEINGDLPGTDQVQQVQYRINGGSWNTYTTEFEVSGEGSNNIEYRVVDVSGNTGNVQSLTVKINSSEQLKVPAFPGAEGAGMYTKGGRGGEIYIVDNLNDYDITKGEAAIPGSIRDAISKGNRMIVFKTSGTINLKRGLDITNGNLTIAGQTAPGDGIAISGYMVKFGNNDTGTDIIVRYIRFRNGIDVLSDTADIAGNNVIVDHCSFSWSTDETFTVKNRKNFTVQWSIISDSLNQSIHDKGAHGYGGIWGGTNATYHHNLIVNHNSRNPRFDRQTDPDNFPTKIDYRNNVVYNWGGNSAYGGEMAVGINMINNYYKPGPSTFDGVKSRIVAPSGKEGSGTWFIDGNFIEGAPDVSADNWVKASNGTWKAINPEGVLTRKYKPMIIPDALDPIGGPVATDTAAGAYDKVLQGAGASLPKRDSLDAKIMNEVKAGTGRLINTIESDGGLPELISAAAPVDSDADGIPDSWESAHNLNPNDKADGALVSSSGYANLEEYMNSLVIAVLKNPIVSIVSPTLHQAFTVNNPITITAHAQAADSNGSIAKVTFYDGNKKLGDAAAAPFTFSWENAPEGEHYVYAKAADNKGVMTLSSAAIIYVNGPDNVAPWKSQDIGQVKIPGSASVIDTTYKVKGSGAIGSGSQDNFQYVYQPVQGNFEMIANVNFASEIDSDSKAGLMIRNSLEPDSPAALLTLSPDGTEDKSVDTSGRKISFLNRHAQGGSFSEIIKRSSNLKAPFWLKITKDQNMVYGYYSQDAANWILVGSTTVNLPDQFYVGMAVDAPKSTSNSDYLTAAKFDGVMFHRSANFSVSNASSVTVDIPEFTLSGHMIDSAYVTITNNGSTVSDSVYIQAGEDFSKKIINLSVGENRIEVSAINNEVFGNIVNKKTLLVFYNKSAVVVTLSGEQPTVVTSPAYDLKATVNKDAAVSVKLNGNVVLDSTSKTANELFSVPLNLREGLNDIVISALDDYGNEGMKAFRITYSKDWGGGLFAVSGIYLSDLGDHALSGLGGSQDTVAGVTFHNNSGVDQSGVFVIALYDQQNRMVRYSFIEQIIPVGSDTSFKALINVPANITGYKLKAFVWNNISNKTVISNVVSTP
jgi:pectin methylesterase-like acyl-CoA thioesterase